MDIFTLIQRYLARSFGIALQFPGQLLLVSKERLGAPIGVVLKKDFELFGISFSLDVEYSLLKRKLAFDISASETFNVLGIEITPTIILGKYGVAATLEIGANNYYLSAGIGLDRIPGFSVGVRKGATGFELSFGGGFADELQFFSGYKSFTIPLGIDFRGRDRNFDRGIPENAGYNTIDYINNGFGVLVPVNNNLVPFERPARSLTVEIPDGLVAESFGLRSRSVRNSAGNEANRRVVEQIIKSQGGIAGDNVSNLLFVQPGGLVYNVSGDPARALSEVARFLQSENVDVSISNSAFVGKARDALGFYRAPELDENNRAGLFLRDSVPSDYSGSTVFLQSLVAYHETVHFLQNRAFQSLSRKDDSLRYPFRTIGFQDKDVLQYAYVQNVRDSFHYSTQSVALSWLGYESDLLQVEAEAFSTEYSVGSLKKAIDKTESLIGKSFGYKPNYFLQGEILGRLTENVDRIVGQQSFPYSGDREASIRMLQDRFARLPEILDANLADINAQLRATSSMSPNSRLPLPSKISSAPRNSIPLPPVPESLKHLGLTSASAAFPPPKALSATQVNDFIAWKTAVERRNMILAGISYSIPPAQLSLSRANSPSSFFNRDNYASLRYLGDGFSIPRSKF
ncbi:hypothetical protein PN499_26395 [Kamptonema animale CS-326]|uniref:hypothetical protein n=1 Tax=Kamptonema animale TaxID=92934 RepID=UPI00232E6377|nr:hypothetical protein [Kamptonema animale]MDB9514738.1 hypothetical protein [Kamptonema animale CS-326]